jgi:hypothetical protein
VEDWDYGGVGCCSNGDEAVNKMGRTIPSFRIALAIEKEEWKYFLNA